MKERQTKQIKLNIQKEAAEGIYSNIVFMNFNNFEFIIWSSQLSQLKKIFFKFLSVCSVFSAVYFF
ncbi:MAG: hypothetical protein RAP70_10895 [Candidatus Celaenobacter antarcticus]|nr:hypothetical protein [Candidatus Celaenobacter antarcticus]